jgi:hypothetical protein
VLEKMGEPSFSNLLKSGSDFVEEVKNGDFAAVILMDDHFKAIF